MEAHLNTTRIRASNPGPWSGQDTMEKAIFVRSLGAVCSDQGLVLEEWLSWYGLDAPDELACRVGVSEALQYEMTMQLERAASDEAARFTQTGRLVENAERKRAE